MTENLAARGEGLAGLVAQFRCLAQNVLMRYKSNPQYAGEIFHTEDTYHDLLKLCAALEAAAPAGTAPPFTKINDYGVLIREVEQAQDLLKKVWDQLFYCERERDELGRALARPSSVPVGEQKQEEGV